IMLLAHFQKSGHRPIALVGGATGMIGDPSGKSAERNLLNEETIKTNQMQIKDQLAHFLNFDESRDNAALLLNNLDWMKGLTFLDFIRDVGKHMTVNYMMSKDSVKNRISKDEAEGMSFTEFSYQLVQGYDFLHLHKNFDCSIQMGGSDQWGNITSGTELIRRMDNGKGYALTCPLITKSDGSKFGKTHEGNIWLNSNRTSVYKFHQYWLNTSDQDAEKYIKIFTFLSKEEIRKLTLEHKDNPHLRILQKSLSKEITSIVHSKEAYDNALKASNILFSNNFKEDIEVLDELTFLEIFEGVPQYEIESSIFNKGLDMISALSDKTNFLKSNSEARRALKENAISVNKIKVNDSYLIEKKDLISNKYVILNRGKKSTYIIKVI
ncbi:MAG TPA: tyrosine--tRNA ligase, partial [Flavobacteriaceae bacterium]|nr:tyrosine--tRNA ligase [Flavobacteriaceae bacterium]